MKDRNLILMLPGTGGDYLRIPLPYGYNVPHAAGQVAGAVVHGGMSLADAASALAAVAWESFYPLGSEASLAQTLSPTIGDPIVQLGENRTFYGAPIRPEPFGSPEEPRSQRYWSSINPSLKALTEWLNELGGGDRVTPGRFFTDQSPEDLEHLIEFSFGGVGRQAKRVWDITELALQDPDCGDSPLYSLSYDPMGGVYSARWMYTGTDSEIRALRIYEGAQTDVCPPE